MQFINTATAKGKLDGTELDHLTSACRALIKQGREFHSGNLQVY